MELLLAFSVCSWAYLAVSLYTFITFRQFLPMSLDEEHLQTCAREIFLMISLTFALTGEDAVALLIHGDIILTTFGIVSSAESMSHV